MKQASYLILSILIITGCAYSSQRPDVVDRSIAQRAQSVTFATVVDIDRVVIANIIKRILFPLIFIFFIIFLNILFELDNNYDSIIKIRLILLSFFVVILSIFIFSKFYQIITFQKNFQIN